MTLAAPSVRRSAVVMRAARAAKRAEERRSRIQTVCAVALVAGAAVHVNLSFAHAGTNFGALTLLAAAAQFSLAIAIGRRRETAVPRAILVLEIVLLFLYLVNVTVGLPPAMSHAHDGGLHVVWGFTLALPGTIDHQGVSAVLTEAVGALCAASLLRIEARKRRS